MIYAYTVAAHAALTLIGRFETLLLHQHNCRKGKTEKEIWERHWSVQYSVYSVYFVGTVLRLEPTQIDRNSRLRLRRLNRFKFCLCRTQTKTTGFAHVCYSTSPGSFREQNLLKHMPGKINLDRLQDVKPQNVSLFTSHR